MIDPSLPAEALRGGSVPTRPLPAGAWDCHSHVFGPFDRYPLAPEAKYRPPLAPAAMRDAVLRRAGFARGVVVHAAATGFDISGVIDAAGNSSVGTVPIVVIPESSPAADIERLVGQGVRGLRFTDMGEQIAERTGAGILGLRALRRMAPMMKEVGWQAHVWARCGHLLSEAAWLQDSGIPVVLDHMGQFDPAQGPAGGEFASLLDLVGAGNVWVKLTSARITRRPRRDASDIRPFHDAFVERFPTRVLWGSDWPYIAMDADLPEIGGQVDLFDSWVDDAAIRHRVFVENPGRLYGTR